jgi:glycosyltransferase involved in cell wall biosynthesis
MDVCLVSKMFPPDIGGAETYAYELSNALARAGHNVDVFTMEAATDGEIDIHENVSVTRLMKRRRLVTVDTVLFSLVARRNIDFEAYDVVHGTLMPASTVSFTPGFGMADVPLIVTSHGTSIGEMRSSDPHTYEDYLMKYVFHPMNIVLDSIAGRFANRIIAISDHTQEQLVETYRFDNDRVSMIPHGVDNERFHPDAGPHPAPDSEKFTILYVGRLGPRKGVDLAIESFAELDCTDVELLIAGTGRHEDRLRDLTLRLGIADRVRFLGFVPSDELPALYVSSELFVLLSSYEGYGLVLLESMACGTPVVASRVGGITTVVDGSSGVLVSRDIESITNAIEKFIKRRDFYLESVSAAQTRARDLDWDEVVDKVIYEYAEIKSNI